MMPHLPHSWEISHFADSSTASICLQHQHSFCGSDVMQKIAIAECVDGQLVVKEHPLLAHVFSGHIKSLVIVTSHVLHTCVLFANCGASAL